MAPGTAPPRDAEYWYNAEVDKRFFTFEAPEADVPPSRARWAGHTRVGGKRERGGDESEGDGGPCIAGMHL